MVSILRALKKVWFFSFLRRIYLASRYSSKSYTQILKWALKSNEYTNFTYDLKDSNILYMAHTIAVVTNTDYKVISGYIEEARNDQQLKDHIVHEIKNSPFRKFADLDIYYGRRLGWYAIARVMKPQVIVETGVDKGMGSVLLCSALLKNKAEGFPGKFYGTDIDPGAGYLLKGRYREVGEILYGDSIETLSAFRLPIDLFINDSDHSSAYEYREYQTIQPLLSPHGIILGDNAHYTDKLALFSNETGRQFLFIPEHPKDHWFPGAGIGISFVH
jgi:hypothetical protein